EDGCGRSAEPDGDPAAGARGTGPADRPAVRADPPAAGPAGLGHAAPCPVRKDGEALAVRQHQRPPQFCLTQSPGLTERSARPALSRPFCQTRLQEGPLAFLPALLRLVV